MDNPPDEVRPGLSCTAKITTATRTKAVTIPIQALTIRQKGDLEVKPKTPGATVTPVKLSPAEEKTRKEEVQGVFVIAGGKAEFRKVETGITGSTDIEVLSGLKEGDEIVTGSYQVIRTLRNEAQVKVDNKLPVPQKA
jgi:HlyD family secretion protein